MSTEGVQVGASMQAAAQEFLAGRNMSFADLKTYAPAIGEGECLVLCGPVVQGLANAMSDIDLIYLGEADLIGATKVQLDDVFMHDVSFDPQGNEINVTRLTAAELGRMESLMASSLRGIAEPTGSEHAVQTDPRRLELLHRLRNGLALTNDAVFQDWRRRLLVDQLHEHLCFHAIIDYYAYREDVFGELSDGAVESASWIARTLLAQKLAAALLHSAGITNTTTKWYVKLLQRHRDAIGAETVDGLLNFVARGPWSDAEALKAEIETVLEPAIAAIVARHRAIRRATLAFGHTLRYRNLRKMADTLKH